MLSLSGSGVALKGETKLFISHYAIQVLTETTDRRIKSFGREYHGWFNVSGYYMRVYFFSEIRPLLINYLDNCSRQA